MSRETSNWFYIDRDLNKKAQIKGPILYDSISRLFFDKIISASTIFWNENTKSWVPLESIPIYQDLLMGEIKRKQNSGRNSRRPTFTRVRI